MDEEIIVFAGCKAFRGFDFRPAIRQVRFGMNGDPVVLSPTLAKILEVLLRNCNRELSSKELMKLVDPERHTFSEVTTRGHILEIRRALGEQPRTPSVIRNEKRLVVFDCCDQVQFKRRSGSSQDDPTLNLLVKRTVEYMVSQKLVFHQASVEQMVRDSVWTTIETELPAVLGEVFGRIAHMEVSAADDMPRENLAISLKAAGVSDSGIAEALSLSRSEVRTALRDAVRNAIQAARTRNSKGKV